MLRADSDRFNSVRNRCRDHDANRLDLKDARICRIEHPIAATEAHLALHALDQIIVNAPPSALVNDGQRYGTGLTGSHCPQR